MSSEMPEPLIGHNGLLLHIGPHKSGTSAIQGALHREGVLLEQGVTVVGTHWFQSKAARAVTEFSRTPGMEPGTAADWDRLVRTCRAVTGRQVISTEYFDIANTRQAQRIVSDLGPERVHVVVTAAPLTSVLPSNWQQRLRTRFTGTLDDWLTTIFDDHDANNPTIFWRRQRLDWQVERWAEAVGLDRVHVVVVNKDRRRQLFDAFEDLLGLPRETLQPNELKNNSSLRWSEAELLRQINLAAAEEKWTDTTHARFARLGAARGMDERKAASGDPAIQLPTWAFEKAAEIASLMAENLRASGVHIIGDLATLIPVTPTAAAEPVTTIDVQTAVSAVLGTARAGGAGILHEKYVRPGDLKQYPGVSSAPTPLLTEELARRKHHTLDVSKVPTAALTKELARRNDRTFDGAGSAQMIRELRQRAKRKVISLVRR